MATEKVFRMVKRTVVGEIEVFFHVEPEKVHIITVGSCGYSGSSAFTETVEEARTAWKKLLTEGFKPRKVA